MVGRIIFFEIENLIALTECHYNWSDYTIADDLASAFQTK
jgi:hypothetical protein